MKKSVLLGFFVLMVLVVGMSGVFADDITSPTLLTDPTLTTQPALTIPPASTQPTISWTQDTSILELDWNNWKDWIKAWEKGQGINIFVIKWLFLFFIVILVYSAVSFVNFPENGVLQFVLAFIISFIGIAFINPNAIAAATASFGAMSIALILIIPLLVLGFFTFVMAVKGKVVGILLQRVMWAIYCVYLFFISGYALISNSANKFTGIKAMLEYLEVPIYSPTGNRLVMLVMFVSSIILFFSVVLFNKWFTTHLMADARETAVEKYKDIILKDAERQKIGAKVVEEAGK